MHGVTPWSMKSSFILTTPSHLKGEKSRWQMLFKICVLKNLAIFTEKHLCCSLFLMQALKIRIPTQLFACEYC